MNTNILSFKTYTNKSEQIHLFEPYNNEIRSVGKIKYKESDISKIDTIVVPARKDGFNEVFIGENCWFAIKMSSSMIEKIKYIAAYQISPISAVTHYATVDRIEKYDIHNKHSADSWDYTNQNKYILYFKSKAKKIGPLKLNKFNPPQSPRYTTSEKLFKAKELKDLF